MSTPAPETHTGTPQPSPEVLAGFQIDALDAWRASEDAVLIDLRNHSVGLDASYIDTFRSGVAQRLEAYLQAQGIAQSDPYYNDIRDLYAGVGIDQIDSNRWDNSPASIGTDPNDDLSQRDKFADALRQWQENHTVPASDDPDKLRPMTPEEWAAEKGERNSEYEAIMTKYAELVAKRGGKLFERKRTRAEIDAAKEDVTDLLSGLATQMMDELLAEGKSEAEMAELVGNFVDEQSDLLANSIEQSRIDNYEGSWRITKMMANKWAKWTEQSTDKETGKRKFLSWGNIKKMGSMAVMGAALGAGVTLALPALGFAGGVAGTFGIAGVAGFASARSIGRSLAGGFLDKKSSEKRVATEQSAEMKEQYKKLNDENTAQEDLKNRKTIFEIVDERSTAYRKRNRNRVIASVAIAGVAGVAAGTLTNFFSHGGSWFHNEPSSSNTDTATWKDIPQDKYTQPASTSTTEIVWDADTATEHVSSAASTISRGEGLYQTFQDHGVQSTHWRELINEVGPKLDEKYPELVYFDKNAHEWRLYLNDGKMPDGASKIILETAHEHNWLNSVTEASGKTSVAVDVSDSTIVDQSNLQGLNDAMHDNANWGDMKNEFDTLMSGLKDGNVNDINSGSMNEELQQLLGYAHDDFGAMKYPNSNVSIIVYDNQLGRWQVNPVPNGSYVPKEALNIMGRYYTSLYALAA